MKVWIKFRSWTWTKSRFIFVLYFIFLGRIYSIIQLSGDGLKKCGCRELNKYVGRVTRSSSNIGDILTCWIGSSGSCSIEDILICCTGCSSSCCIVLSEVCVERSEESFIIVVLSFS
jgi:hypothetical protein